jgi:5''-nucleotidase, lipoprotein e(P4) family
MKTKNYLLSLALIGATAFTTYFATATTTAQQGGQTQQVQTADNEYQVAAILYMQKSAEYRALCYQAFNWARKMLDADEKTSKKLPKSERKKPRAVVVDIDETVLDNSPAQAFGVINKRPFNLKDWYAWGEMRKAKALPGAVEFAKYAAEKNVRIFYISNRDEVQKQATIENLKAAGFPDISEENVILRQKESAKEPRRAAVAEKYRIVLLMGDNLNDFSAVFERKSIDERFAETDKVKNLWGEKFIVLPNAMYGDWESAIYEYQRLTEEQKADKRKQSLELP